MIFDRLDNIDRYKGQPLLYQGLCFLQEKRFAEGYVELSGKDLFANAISFTTSTQEKDYEAHRKYIDLFYMVEGEESIEVTQRELCATTEPYSIERDIEKLSGTALCRLTLGSGMFCALFPEDIHKPGIAVHEELAVKKIVVKVRCTECQA